MKEQIIKILKDAIDNLTIDEINELIEIPPKPDMGDFAFPCFKLAKTFKKSPALIAEEVKDKIKQTDFIVRLETAGPYVNFFVDKKKYGEYVLNKFFSSSKYGTSSEGKNKTIVIDYSSPNIAKKFHIGHLRTTIIGNALYKIFGFLGYNCIGINHLGDWGTQFGKLIVAYKKWGDEQTVLTNGIDELGKLYVKFHDEAEKDASLNDEARYWFTKMEQGNEEALSLWKWFKEISLAEFEKVYELLNIKFDSYAGESFYIDKMQPVIDELQEKNLLKNSEGAHIVDLSAYDMSPGLITKSDGSTLYTTRDLAAAFYRKKTYDFEKCIYVTGLEQKLHFSQVFKIIQLMGYDWYEKMIHVPYGLVSMDTGKLSTRKGNIILVEELLNQAIEKTEEIINEKNPGLEEKDKVAKQVGIGAVIFNDLYNSRIKDVVFSWKKVLSFEGETGPYVQYTHARAVSVLRKANIVNFDKEIDYDVLDNEITFTLLKQIEKFPYVVKEAGDKLEPFIISRYVVDLAQTFNKFYHECPIIVDQENIKNTRLHIVYIVKVILKDALNLIGIEAPDKM